ncbi:MAG: cytochrome c biogenesis heme-transporting ATPase CcmA [Candidatus Berkiella sp.]
MSLALKNITHAKGHKVLFRHVNLTLQAGQRLLIQGANGSGKSTLLKIIAGLLTADRGVVTWQGQKLQADQTEYFSKMSYLGHQNGLKKALTVLENLRERLCLANAQATPAQIADVLGSLGLSAKQQQICDTLSAGECRKVALAAVLLSNKPLWILDEPFNSLDKASYHQFQENCETHLAQGGLIVLACHQGSHHYQGSQVIDLSLAGSTC